MSHRFVLSLGAAKAALVALSLVPGAAESAERTQYSLESAGLMPVPVLAESLLGRERASDVVKADIATGMINDGLFAITFFHRPVPVDADLCLQLTDYVSFAGKAQIDPGDSEAPARWKRVAASTNEWTAIALAPGCRLAPDQRFAQLQGLTIDAAKDAFRSLAAAQLAARGQDPLPFTIVCTDETAQNYCTDSRSALASLPIQRAFIVRANGVTVSMPDRTVWTVRISDRETDRATVSMRRFLPPPA